MGFKQVIGDSEKLLLSHNTSKLVYTPVLKKPAKKIRVVYWGIVRQIDFNKKVMDFFGRDSRFELVYHGTGFVRELEEYCKEKNYQHIHFTGRYTSDQIASFVQNTDILLNLYENDTTQKLATTVKLYDGMRYGIPMLIAKDSYMEFLLKNNEYVASVDLEKNNTDMVYEWYSNLQKEENPYSQEIVQIQKDEDIFEKRLLTFIRD